LVNSRIEENSDGKKGIKVTFLPDEKIFQEFTHFKIENIKNRLKELAYLNPNIKISFSFSPEEDPEFFYYSSGLTG
jgi:DNA gyrase subunit B